MKKNGSAIHPNVGRLPLPLRRKWERLGRILKSMGSCVVAFSGGVDSGLLLSAAREVLGDRCLAWVALSPIYHRREQTQALAWLRRKHFPFRTLVHPILGRPEFFRNPPERCYACKKSLFGSLRRKASELGIPWIVEGSQLDDRRQIRPGRRALRELGILSPLEKAGLNKTEVRWLARRLYGLPMATKPSNACLATRVAFGTAITSRLLNRIERMEEFLLQKGLKIFRARYHPGLLRLELGPEEFRRLQNAKFRQVCIQRARQLGFVYVTADLMGFRSGSGHELARLG